DIMEAALYKERLRMLEEVMREKFSGIFYTEKVKVKTLRIVYCPSLPEKDTVKLFRLVNGCIYVNAALQADVEVYGLADYRFATIADDTCYKLSLT
ncbi:hypothetical protein NK983_27110, partial [Salmonella enterica subsp. enterica serovar Typhimurium]|nr:hypothetical protein [Salmonella enterica subsp. enterica serovar Typhimurium]